MDCTREGKRAKTKARHPSDVTSWRKVRQVRPRWETSRAVGRSERIRRRISWGRSERLRLGLVWLWLWFGAVMVMMTVGIDGPFVG